MRAFGPFAQTAGTLIHVRAPQNHEMCFIKNISPNDLWICFDPMAPPLIPFGNQIQLPYVESIPAYHAIPVQIQKDGAWSGDLWILPVNPSQLAQTGASSARANVYVSTYETGEKIPQAYAEGRQSELTSQPRVIHIPVSPTFSYSGDHAWVGNDVIRPFPSPLVLSPGGGSQPFTLNVHVYLYAYLFSFITASSGALIFILNIEELDSSLTTVIATHQLSEFGISSATDVAPRPFYPAIPKQITFQPLNTCRALQLALFDQTPAVSVRMTYEILVDVDIFNTGNNSWVTAIGGGATGTPVAAVYGSGGELF